ncbi:bifunctional diguanylate cyclase/phosphodiesterase [Undibacterium fentianense]|uniref:EAL domain-containing protein n=1 Tax=Undibacterium fentianense TaxID=2828728 RepID=A0A941E6N1_9BURK|nr:EAL domain-containing protein [Undibacterium fentianense]MBR7799703.1 EAL domain-containing protein [Undibacterium fentianense]
MVRIRKLHTRIIFAFSVLLSMVLIVELAVVNSVVSQSANEAIERNLLAGERLFNSIREDNIKRLSQSAGILTSDFAFIKATATGDHNTIVSVLLNHGGRINADMAMLVAPDNRVIADTLRKSVNDQAFPFPELIKRAELKGQTTSIVTLDGKLYQLIVVPVMAPLPVAWLALGFVIDDKFARNLKGVTGLDVSFLTPITGSDRLNVLATTLNADRAADLSSDVNKVSETVGATTKVLKLSSEEYLARIDHLKIDDGTEAITVLQQSLDIALAPLFHLRWILTGLGFFALIATLVAGYQIARNISKPLVDLSQAAQDIEAGHYYTQTTVIARDDEVGQLATAFQNMSKGIASREDKISELAYRDRLTGLANRTLFSISINDRINKITSLGNDKASANSSDFPFAILLIDIDRFKEVNDILGHHIGDLLLQEIAQRLQVVVAQSDAMVARLGGDEFGILTKAVDQTVSMALSQAILAALDKPILLEGHQLIASGSIGIVHFPTDGNDINALLRHAELAMYTAKRNNSGSARYDTSLESASQQNLSLMAELKQAIEHNELQLYYQPKVDLHSNTISEVEALIRWIHPKRGVIPPDQFIPFAESTGFIAAITEWVIARALEQRAVWQTQGFPLSISVNISARDLLNAKLPGNFAQLMETHNASTDWLSLEITESAIMTDPEAAMQVLNQLRENGLAMSIDDFGTGYSSLAYLKKLPVTELKIDKSFITEMENNPDDAIIVRSTIDLGHNMGLRVIAEGVENQATWDALVAMGCDSIQGYFVSRPLAAEKLMTWLQHSQWKFKEKPQSYRLTGKENVITSAST